MYVDCASMPVDRNLEGSSGRRPHLEGARLSHGNPVHQALAAGTPVPGFDGDRLLQLVQPAVAGPHAVPAGVRSGGGIGEDAGQMRHDRSIELALTGCFAHRPPLRSFEWSSEIVETNGRVQLSAAPFSDP